MADTSQNGGPNDSHATEDRLNEIDAELDLARRRIHLIRTGLYPHDDPEAEAARLEERFSELSSEFTSLYRAWQDALRRAEARGNEHQRNTQEQRKEERAMDLQRLRGIVPPILTPLNDDETVDTDSMKALVEHVISNGCHGIWVTGTTGEFPCLDEKQRAIAVQTAVEAANGRVPVVAGIGDASTNLAVRHAKNAKSAGADFIALVPPYYYLNSQDEQLTHYRSMRERVDMPLMVYNIPQTVKIKLDVKTVLTLLEEGVIMGLKDSQNDLDWFRQVMIGAKRLNKPFRSFLGTRYLIDAGTIVGAHGSIPSIANVAPAIAAAVYDRSIAGDWAGADRAQTKLGDIALRVPSVPAMKAALVAQGVLKSPRMTLPFKTFSSAEVEKIGELVAEVGLSAD